MADADVTKGVADEGGPLAGFSRVRVAMVLTDPHLDDNPIVYVNQAFERTTGFERSAVVGRNCRFLQGEATEKRDVDRIRSAIEAEDDVSVDILNYRADGRAFTNRLIIAPITDGEGEVIYFLGIQKELSDEDLTAMDDDVLMKVRERVTGDLSMLLASIRDTSGEPFEFEAMTRRMECLNLVYESLRLSDDHRDEGIDLGSLLSRVGAAIAHGEGRAGIRFIQAIEPMQVNVDAAVRIALIVSEVLANAFDHAFDRMDEGVVELRIGNLAAGGFRLVVSDDGVGLPKNAPFPDPDTIGGRLLAGLSDGLDATLTPVRGAAGTVVMVDIPVGVAEL